MKLLCLSGSFHSESRSLAILEHIQKTHSNWKIDIADIHHLPFFSPDINIETHPDLKIFHQQFQQCDGVICCTPEYNHSIPAVLKNAIDWVSRPAYQSPLKDKPITIITQGMSPVGGARAQAHLKLILDAGSCCIHRGHEMMIPFVADIFDEHKNIIDEKTQERLYRHIKNFGDFIELK